MSQNFATLAALPTVPTAQNGPAPGPPPGMPTPATVSSALNDLSDMVTALDSELASLEDLLVNVLRPAHESQKTPSDGITRDAKVACSPVVGRINDLRAMAETLRGRIRSVVKRLEV